MVFSCQLRLLPASRLVPGFAVAALFWLFSVSARAADTDIVEFGNGNRLIGEVKSMGRGQLSFDTDATGTINIEWADVRFLTVDQDIQVEILTGARFFGRIERADNESSIVVATGDGPIELENRLIVEMNPIESSWIEAIDLRVSAGYNFTKASNVTQFNVGIDAAYRTRKRIVSADFSSLISNSTNNDSSQRQLLDLNYTRLRANRWLNDGGIRFEHNDELGLNLRTSLSAGGGRILRQTSHSSILMKGGLKATRENAVNDEQDTDSLESYGLLSWEWYRYESPELDWSSSLEIIPSLTESGRVRAEFDATLSWEIINDFFWQLEFYESYDNQPQSATGASRDYGVTTSVSYKF